MTDPVLCVILGAGGHAGVLIDSMRRAGQAKPDCLIDKDSARWNTELYGVPIVGGDDMLDRIRARGVRNFAVGVGRNGKADRRGSLFDHACSAGFEPTIVVDPTALVSELAQIGPGAQILARAIINAGSRIARNAVINTGAIVEHDCFVGDHAFIGPGVVLGGGVSIADGAFVGIGAILLPGVSVGAGAMIGAGAVVRAAVAPAATVVGVPARSPGSRR